MASHICKIGIIALIVSCPLLGNESSDVPADFVKACVSSRVEGKQPDLSLLHSKQVESVPPKPTTTQGERIQHHFTLPNGPANNFIDVLEDGTCMAHYELPTSVPVASEFSMAERIIKSKYFRGVLGAPISSGAHSGFWAYWIAAPAESFDVGYGFNEKDGVRTVNLFTNKKKPKQ